MDPKIYFDFAQTIGIVFTMAYTLYSNNKSKGKERADAIARIYSRLDTINLVEINKPELARKLHQPFVKESEDQYDVIAYAGLLNSFVFEVYYLKTKYKSLEDNEWRGWLVTFKHIYNLPFMASYWPTIEKEYQEDFQKFVKNGF